VVTHGCAAVSEEGADDCGDVDAPALTDADGDAPMHPLTAGSSVATMIVPTSRCERLFMFLTC
jgi:hypothetical protein